MTPEEITEALGRLSELTAEELSALETALTARAEELAVEARSSNSAVAELTEIVENVATVRGEIGVRETEAADRNASVDAALAKLSAPAAVVAPEITPEMADAGLVDAGVTSADTAKAVFDAAVNVEMVGPRVPASRAPQMTAPQHQFEASVQADVPGLSPGTKLTDMNEIAKAFVRRRRTFGASNVQEMIPIVSFGAGEDQFSPDRYFNQTDMGDANQRKIEAVTSPQALTASGGLCAPLTPYYPQANISDASRPVWDSLPQFGADRGGIRFIQPLKLPSFSTAVFDWRVADDNNAVAGSPTKPCYHVACGSEQTVTLDAITRCLEFGNLGARAYPEQVAQAIAVTLAAHARLAERQLINAIGNASIAVSAANHFGTARDIVATLRRAGAGYRNRNRTAFGMPLRLIIQRWVYHQMCADLAREQPGWAGERLAMSEAQINQFFEVQNLNVTWSMEGEPAQPVDFGAQAAGALDNWPATAIMYLFHEGAFLGLDGGVLDLGLVRDSTLNKTNDYRIFAENFQSTAFVGVESLRISQTVCPTGSSSLPQTSVLECTGTTSGIGS